MSAAKNLTVPAAGRGRGGGRGGSTSPSYGRGGTSPHNISPRDVSPAKPNPSPNPMA